jgi:hypothetical protein
MPRVQTRPSRRPARFLGWSVLALGLLPATAAGSPSRSGDAGARPARPCAAGQLRGSFSHVPDSDATGHSLYRLRLRTRSGRCSVASPLHLQLLGSDGQRLPTHLPGGGEPLSGPCEPTARSLRIALPGGHLSVPLDPPTAVCDRGRLVLIPGL